MRDVRFSVITPTNRKPQSLLRMLAALNQQDYPAENFEVIVVVDGDDTELNRALQGRRYRFPLRSVRAEATGPAAARNDGLAAAREPYALFLDDDVLPEPALVRRHAESHAEADLVVIGPLLAAHTARPAAWTRWEWVTLEEQYRAMETGQWQTTPRQFYTGNASVRLDDVIAVGGFNPHFRRGEDVELAWRLHARGLRFVFDPRARAQHLAARSYDAWLNAAYEYGRTDVMLERIRTGRDLPGWVQREFQSRNPWTRLLARSVVRRPEIWGPIPACGRLAMEVADRLGMAAATSHACSALFTAAYWRGVSEQLGRSRALALTQSPATSVSIENVA